MQTMLQQRIARLRWLSALLLISLTAAWVGLMFYLPLYDGETLTSMSTKCALVFTLVVIGKVPSRLKSGVRNTCLTLAWIVFFFFIPVDLAWNFTSQLALAVIVVFGVLDLIVETRLWRLSRNPMYYYK
ncbi:hypothetical protein [Pseudomonas putida]|uniref:hypothetical protein n=1 Tax=Pseudomonas putida TaxID=303 RepID=UPI0037FFA8F9